MTARQLHWYCRFMGMELGPMPLADLVELVRQGELAPDDDVRCDGADDWRPAHVVPELAAILGQMQTGASVDRSSDGDDDASLEEGFELSAVPEPLLQASVNRAVVAALANVRSSTVAKTAQTTTTAHEERWFCRVRGVAYGPIRFSQLLKIIGYRRLDISADDLVKHGVNGEWVRVDSVPALMHAAGLDEVAADSEPSVRTPAYVDAMFAVSTFLRRWSIGIPSIPAPSAPQWLRAGVRRIGRGLRFVGKYAIVILPITIWASINVIAVFFPATAEELGKQSLAALASPAAWFALVSLAAYSGAIWLNARHH